MEKMRIPFPLLLPKPVFVIVDQFEEVLRTLVRCLRFRVLGLGFRV